MVATAIVLLCTLASAPQKAEVTFKDPPARLENLLASLSDTTQVRLSCSNALKDRVLFIQVQEVPLDDLKRHIAYVVDGKWEESAQRSFLVVDEEQQSERRKEFYGIHSADVQKALKEMRKDVPKEFDDEVARNTVRRIQELYNDPQWMDQRFTDERQKAFSGAPAARLGAILFTRLLEDSPDELPLFKAGRAVFTNLRSNPYGKISVESSLLKEYDRTQFIWDKVATEYEMTAGPNMLFNSSMRSSRSNRPAKTVFLMANRPTKDSRTEIAIAVLDEHDEYKAGAEFYFQNPLVQRRTDALRSGGSEGRKIVLSDEAVRYSKAVASIEAPSAAIPHSDPFYAKAVTPVKNDPMGFVVGEVVGQALASRGRHIVAELIDDLASVTFSAARDQYPTVTDVLRRFEISHESQIEGHDDGFVTMRFRDPDKHLGNFPRESLQNIAQTFGRLGYVDLKTLVEHGFPPGQFVVQSLNRAVPQFMVKLLAPGYYFALATFNQTLPRYASALTTSERSALLAGDPLIIGRLTPASKRGLNRILVDGADEYGEHVPRGYKHAPRDLSAVLMFPYGLTDDTVLQIEAEIVTGIAAYVPIEREYASKYVIGAERSAAHGIGVRLATANEPPKFWLGRHLTGSFVLKRGGKNLVTYQVELPMIDVRGKALSLTDLSEDFQKSIEASRQRKIKAMEAGDDGPIPPPN